MKKQRFKKIYIEITNICNLSCEFCNPDNRKKEYMTIENFEHILNKITGYTEYIYLHVKGEPCLHPKINEFIEMAHKKNFKVNITTNGTLIELLKNKNIRQINYSMQSSENVLEIKETIRKLRNFIEGTNIYLSLRLWSNKINNNEQLKELLIDEFDVLNDIEEINDHKKLDKNIFLSIENEFEWPDIEKNDFLQKEGYCYGLKSHIAILVDGTIVPCCLDNNGTINLGNIYKNTIQEILENKRTINIVEGFKNRKAIEELCQKCCFKNNF